MIEISKNSRPHNWLIHHICVKSIRSNLKYISGQRVLDVGCGIKPYAHLIEPICHSYLGLDRIPAADQKKIDIYGDALSLPFSSCSFDALVSFQVMEHVKEPEIFLSEAFRVLKGGGHALITTPFMWAEHEQPHDYYRYTRYGLKYLAEKAGFIVLNINPDTGPLTSSAFRITYWLDHFRYGPFRKLLYPLYAFIQVSAFLLDKLDSTYRVDPATFTTVLKKPE